MTDIKRRQLSRYLLSGRELKKDYLLEQVIDRRATGQSEKKVNEKFNERPGKRI